MNLSYPHAKEAESAVIGAIFIQPELISLAVQSLTPEMFYVTQHQTVYGAMVELDRKGQKVDYLSVFQLVKKKDPELTIYSLTQFTKDVLRIYAFEQHVEIVKDKFLKRQLITESLNVASVGSQDEQPANQILGTYLAKLAHISNETDKDINLPEMIVNLGLERANRGIGKKGYSTGYPSLDEIFSLNPSDLFILAARPSHGKTAVSMNLLLNLAFHQNLPCMFVSLEMPYMQILERMESCLTGIDLDRVTRNYFTEEENKTIAQCHQSLADKPIYIIDPSRINTQQLRAKVSMYVAKHDVKIVFVDYLQLLDGTGKDTYEKISDVSRSLKAIAKEFKVCMVALAQLSRAVESRQDKMPILSDLRESGQIEQDADVVVFLMNPQMNGIQTVEIGGEEISAQGKLIVKQSKYRHGEPNKIRLMDWDGAKMQVKEHRQSRWKAINETMLQK